MMQENEKKNIMDSFAEIFQEGSDARQTFGKYYAVVAIIVILTVLGLLALATQG